MSPRAYSMGRRAEQFAQTRARIVDAALEVFGERGARGTTMTEVARVADVSPATVTNHFATPDLLLEAVVERLITRIQVPNRNIFTGSTSLDDRIRDLTAAMFEFYDRTRRWFELLGAELTEVPALARAQADYWRSIQALYAEALAGTQDEVLTRATAGLVHPATFNSLQAAGLSAQEAADVVADAITHLAKKRIP
jgi:AcrR family transcriptional regulator